MRAGSPPQRLHRWSMISVSSKHEIIWDGRSVWVNDETGCCIGRFTRRGVDVHKTGPDQVATGIQCLDCFHDVEPAHAWDRFVRSMKLHHGVSVPVSARPGFVLPAPHASEGFSKPSLG